METGKTKTISPFNPIWPRLAVGMAIILAFSDMVYAYLSGINLMNREMRCIIYTSVPRWVFLFYEHFFELFIVVLIGVFASVVLEEYFRKLKRFFPKNQVLAFLYGSILPVCSCGVIPLIEVMKERLPLRVIVTFVIAAPLLNPYIIVLSVSVMGLEYCIVRVIASFVVAITAGLFIGWVVPRFYKTELRKYGACPASCRVTVKDPFSKTLIVTRKLLPYILIGGALGFVLEIFNPKQFLAEYNFSNQWLSMIILVLIGIPLYVCNGADIILLKPFLDYTDLTLGSAMVFSLTSSSVCLSSIVLLSKFFGKKLAVTLAVFIGIISLLIGIILNFCL